MNWVRERSGVFSWGPMRTDNLIKVLAADSERTRPVEAALPAAVLATAAVVGVVFFGVTGPRPDLVAAFSGLNVLIKHVFPVLLAIGSFLATLRLARPGADIGPSAAGLGAVALILLAAVVAELRLQPEQNWYALFLGSTLLFCLTAISVMSLPLLGASLWVLRGGASTRPALTGAAAGLLSGSIATAIFAFHCIEDSPLFYASWYSLAILAITGLGAMLGSRFLRW